MPVFSAPVFAAGAVAASPAPPQRPGATEVFLAIDAGSAPRLSTLVADGADPNVLDDKGEPALIYALHHEHADLVPVLLAAPGVVVDAENPEHQTALMVAAYQGRVRLMQALLDAGAEVGHTGWTALHFAVLGGQEEATRFLLDHSAYVDAESPNGTTPLMAAARGKSRPLCILLIAADADPTPVNQAGLSAAGFAGAAGDEELATWLKENEIGYRHRHPSLFSGQNGGDIVK